MRQHGDTGDGDRCPLVPDHGKMFVLPSGTQYCGNQTHDGVPGKNGTLPTRKFWPFHHLDEAVAEWRKLTATTGEKATLPDLDITLEV